MNTDLINNLIATANTITGDLQNLILDIQETELPNQDELYNENLMEVPTDDAEESIVQAFMKISKALTDAMMGDSIEDFFKPDETNFPPAIQMILDIEEVLVRPSVKKVLKRLDKKLNPVEKVKPLTAFEKVGRVGCKECPRCPYWYVGEKGLRDHMERDICSRVAVGQILRPANPDKVKVDGRKIYWPVKNLDAVMPRCILQQKLKQEELIDEDYDEADTEDTESTGRCSVCEGKMSGLDNGSDDCYCDYCYDCGERLLEGEDHTNDGEMVCDKCYVEEEVKVVTKESPYDEDGFCKYCNWNSCYGESHIVYCGYGNCVYIQEKYGVLQLKEMMDSEFVEELEEDEEEEFNVEEHLALAEAYRAEQKKNAEENNLHQVCCLNCGLKKYVTEEIKNKGYYYCVGSCMGF